LFYCTSSSTSTADFLDAAAAVAVTAAATITAAAAAATVTATAAATVTAMFHFAGASHVISVLVVILLTVVSHKALSDLGCSIQHRLCDTSSNNTFNTLPPT
jgi:hypothetical protein